MTLALAAADQALLAGAQGPAAAMALRIVAEAARLMGAASLIAVESAHLDGCLYHGDSGVHFAERMVALGGKVAVPTTLNVGALDLLHPGRVRFDPETASMARRLMAASEAIGARATWTCAPYQAGHRPRLGAHVAWGESNAVAFVNSVLGARTNRLGDFLDLCCAITGRAPCYGLHLDQNRRARLVFEAECLRPELLRLDAFYPVLGALIGSEAGSSVAAITGLPPDIDEDRLKAVGAAAASTGAVGLFRAVGVTPESPDLAAALGGGTPERRIALTPEMLRQVRDRLSTAAAGSDALDAVAVGSPHFSPAEFRALAGLTGRARYRLPFYACTSRATLDAIEREGLREPLEAAGLRIVVDTCVVVAPILPADAGVLMTNSGKFAFYAPANTGFAAVYGSLADCVASAISGRITRDERLWS